MRKKICSYCNKVVEDTHVCSKKPKSRRTERAKESDKLINCKRWRDKRQQILQRDNYMCMRCWHKYGIINTDNLQVHHIRSRIEFPHLAYEDSNLVTTCQVCNLQLDSVSGDEKIDFDWNAPEREFNL